MKTIQTKNAPLAVGPYAQGVKANGFVFCAGQIGINPKTNILVNGLENQVHQVMKNLQAVLQAVHLDVENVVKTTIYMKNMDEFTKINEIYSTYFPNHKPARATVEVSNLPKGALVEIDAIAVEETV